jgi:hypothetical protein
MPRLRQSGRIGPVENEGQEAAAIGSGGLERVSCVYRVAALSCTGCPCPALQGGMETGNPGAAWNFPCRTGAVRSRSCQLREPRVASPLRDGARPARRFQATSAPSRCCVFSAKQPRAITCPARPRPPARRCPKARVGAAPVRHACSRSQGSRDLYPAGRRRAYRGVTYLRHHGKSAAGCPSADGEFDRWRPRSGAQGPAPPRSKAIVRGREGGGGSEARVWSATAATRRSKAAPCGPARARTPAGGAGGDRNGKGLGFGPVRGEISSKARQGNTLGSPLP